MNPPEQFMQTRLANKFDRYEKDIGELTISIDFLSNRLKYLRGLIAASQQKNIDEEIQHIHNNIDTSDSKIKDISKKLEPLSSFTIINNSTQDSDSNQPENKNEIKKPFHISPHLSGGGILNYLITSQTSSFNRLVIPSQSSGDVYSVIDKNDPGNYSSGSGDYEWIQFEFPEEIEFTSFSIKSAHRSFLKTWNIIGYDSNDEEVELFHTKNDQSLNGKYNEVRKEFIKKFKTNKLRLEKFGSNWSNTNFFRILHIDFYSDDPKFQGKGVIEKFIEESPEKDPHKSMVYVTASNFDFRFYHMINPRRSICTLYDTTFPWFQVELVAGSALITGYRLIQNANFPLLHWTIEGSNDKQQWDVIHEQIFEDEFQCNIFLFKCNANKPYKYFRVVNKMIDDEDNMKLRLRHFDIFGTFYPNECKIKLPTKEKTPIAASVTSFQSSDDETKERDYQKREECKRLIQSNSSEESSTSTSDYYSISDEEEDYFDEEDEEEEYDDNLVPGFTPPF